MSKYVEYRFFPLLVVIFLIGVYALSDYSLIQCTLFVQCKGIDSGFISQVDEKVVHLSNVNAALANKVDAYETRSKRVREKEREIEETLSSVDKIRETLATDANANVAALTADKTKLENAAKSKREEVNTLVADRDKANTEIVAVRNQISVRYSSRLLWVFLTAVFFVLCVAAIVVSQAVIRESIAETKRNHWLFWTTAGAIAFGLFVSVPVFLRDVYPSLKESNYMSLVLPMYEKSFGGNGDLSLDVVNFINAFGFVATIFVLSASCSIIASVQGKKAALAEAAETEIADSDKTSDPDKPGTFEQEHTHARLILYIGGLMLFVAMLRVKLIGDWHLAFISSDPTNQYYKLLAEFLKSSLAVQAGFYTIVLAAIYLPVVNAIQSGYAPPEAKKEEKSTGWLGFSVADVLPRLIAIISPFLAGPLLDFLKYFTNK